MKKTLHKLLVLVSFALLPGCEGIITQHNQPVSDGDPLSVEIARGRRALLPETPTQSISISTIPVKQADISTYLDLSGDVSACSVVEIYGDTAGRLTRVLIQEGDRVEKGQVLALLDPSRPGSTFLASSVRSPAAGTIISINQDEGATVGVQTPLMRISRLDNLQIEARVPERFIGQVKTGQKAQVHSSAWPEWTFTATISKISPIVHSASRTMGITLDLEEAGVLKPGMFVEIQLITATRKNVLILPEEALLHYDSSCWVFRIAGGIAEKVLIETGMESCGNVEVTAGLQAADNIAVEGKNQLSHGSAVRIISSSGNFPGIKESQ